jgi:hypothetical protein
MQIDQIHQSLKTASSTFENKVQKFSSIQSRKQQYGGAKSPEFFFF